MKRKILSLALLCSLLLTGCGWPNNSYVSVTAHKEQRLTSQSNVIAADGYQQLRKALQELIASGTEVAAITVADYPEDLVKPGVQRAVNYVLKRDPLGSYAAEDIRYEFGTSSGIPALSVNIIYRHNRSEIQRILDAEDMEAAEIAAADALKGYEPSVVMLVDNYSERDFTQFVQDYAERHPESVMEVPLVTQNLYGVGDSRLVELIFTYQTSRDSLRRMQSEVAPVFDSAVLYVRGDGEDRQKFSQLYAFLMERFDYKLETSITPSYSLLRHGVGDSRAFATVYAAMCRGAGLECMTVTGTRYAEPWTWNIVLMDGAYYHVDLLRSSQQGRYQVFTDAEMDSYVWDYTEYPACTGQSVEPPEETVPDSSEEKS